MLIIKEKSIPNRPRETTFLSPALMPSKKAFVDICKRKNKRVAEKLLLYPLRYFFGSLCFHKEKSATK